MRKGDWGGGGAGGCCPRGPAAGSGARPPVRRPRRRRERAVGDAHREAPHVGRNIHPLVVLLGSFRELRGPALRDEGHVARPPAPGAPLTHPQSHPARVPLPAPGAPPSLPSSPLAPVVVLLILPLMRPLAFIRPLPPAPPSPLAPPADPRGDPVLVPPLPCLDKNTAAIAPDPEDEAVEEAGEALPEEPEAVCPGPAQDVCHCLGQGG